MARTESVAVAGYFPTPDDQLPLIALHLGVSVPVREDGVYRSTPRIAVMDPCAGDGAAVCALADGLCTSDKLDVEIFTCEMEPGRHAALRDRLRHWQDRERALKGDVFRALFERNSDNAGVGLLFLNPPYDMDRVTGRLEERFLARFTAALAPGGILVFVVPYASLAASAETLAKGYRNLSCYRFRGAAFDAYKQAVLFAERREVDLFDADEEITAQVARWTSGDAPELPLALADAMQDAPYTVPLAPSYGEILAWRMCEVDVTSLVAKFRPWYETTRARGLVPVARVVPDLPVAELMHRTYEVAMPPRPAHIAAGIAAGLFNGQKITPDDADAKLPPLLVKGVFDREWRTVEEKFDKKGAKTAEVQVQQPKLVVTVLDLDTHRYHTVQSTIEESSATDVSRMGIADLLKHYGASLMRVMEQQCRILYDPRTDAHKVVVAESPRKLFTAQAHAVRANVVLLRERPGRHPELLGEIGSGKSTVALMTAKTHGARKVLVVCPPHLLDSWKNEVAAVVPEAKCAVLQSVSDLDALKNEYRFTVAVLSREVAKLGHGWEGVAGPCPKCGLDTPGGDLARTRATCEQKTLIEGDDYARFARQLALQLRAYAPQNATVRNILRGRLDKALLKRRGADEEGDGGGKKKPKWRGLPEELVLALRAKLSADYCERSGMDGLKRALLWLHAAAPNADHLLKLVAVAPCYGWQRFPEQYALLLGEGGADAAKAVLANRPSGSSYDQSTPLQRFTDNVEHMAQYPTQIAGISVGWGSGKKKVTLDSIEFGTVEAATRALDAVSALAQWKWSEVCGERLYQAVPEPRRYPLAQRIVKKHKSTFDFLVLDEGHEYATDGSAQERAAHRLTTLGLPTVLMTGSIMNGYAASLFTNMWALSPEFRDEFDRRDIGAFCDRYGYRKRVVQDREDGEVVVFGSVTDRVERSERDAGNAPGVLPLFLFRHLLPSAVTLHKADLRIDLPSLTQDPVPVDASKALLAEYNRLLEALKRQIAADRFEPEISGKLFGALSELPSFLDRATDDVGNGDGGTYEIRYPESCGGELVAAAKMLPAKTILPKEAWMLDAVEAELKAGRNVMVFGWHLGLLPRLQRLLQERTGDTVPILYADKVPTGKRQSWIDREIVTKKRRVMVANPVAIQTGLNNLVHFATEIWHENPACNPIVYRQAVGRIDRIGQKKPTQVLFAYYAQTLQAQMHELLLAKVAISTATDGLDPESALRASGIVEDEYLTGLSIGKQLWAMMEEGLTGEKARPVQRPIQRPVKRAPAVPHPVAAPVAVKVEGLTERQCAVLAAIEAIGDAKIADIAKRAFPEVDADKAESWVRNQLRGLQKGQHVEWVASGTYRATRKAVRA